MAQEFSIHPLLQDDQYHWLQLLPLLQSDRNNFSEEFQLKIQQLAIASSYALEQLCHEPTLLNRLQALKHFELDEIHSHPVDGEAQGIVRVKRRLRQLRHRKLIEIIYLDVVDKISLQATLAHLSDLADLLIRMALEASHNYLAAKHGQPFDGDGNMIELNIIAMGKLGGRELNFSSDIDLICCYDCDGELNGYGQLSYQ